VFGRAVGGMDVINKMEMVPTDDNNRPKIEIKILATEIYANPFDDPLPHELKEQKEKEEKEQEKKDSERGLWFSDPATSLFHTNTKDNASATLGNDSNVGKYLPTNLSLPDNKQISSLSLLRLPTPVNDDSINKSNNNQTQQQSAMSAFRFKNFSLQSKTQPNQSQQNKET